MIYDYANKKLFNAFQTAYLICGKDLSIDFRDIIAFCKEWDIHMDVICFFDYIKDEIDEWAHELGLSYQDDKLYGIGLKPIINVKTVEQTTSATSKLVEQFEYFLQKQLKLKSFTCISITDDGIELSFVESMSYFIYLTRWRSCNC